MGIGFIITIALLGALLGLFARQALSTTTEENASDTNHDETPPHSQAM